MATRVEQKRELLTSELLKMKEEGFRVFINTPENHGCFCYGLITNGEDIVYIQFADYFLTFRMSYQYMPSRNYGSGVMYHDTFESVSSVTKEEVNKVIFFGNSYTRRYGIKRYRNIEHYMEDSFHKRTLEEL